MLANFELQGVKKILLKRGSFYCCLVNGVLEWRELPHSNKHVLDFDKNQNKQTISKIPSITEQNIIEWLMSPWLPEISPKSRV